jgi:transglutaminase-like putative cysteine protease
MTRAASPYLQSTYYLDFDHPSVSAFTERNCDLKAEMRTKAVQLYYAVRDIIKYDPYDLRRDREALQASTLVEKGSGYCVAKSVLLAAAARQQNIPARLGFADVTNHLSTAKLRQIMKSDIFIYHGYTELFLEDRWVKATPAFNLSLCTRFNVKPLEFDGINDSQFHEYDKLGQKHMEYIRDHGNFADLPFDRIFDAYEKQYPGMLSFFNTFNKPDFSKEASQETS